MLILSGGGLLGENENVWLFTRRDLLPLVSTSAHESKKLLEGFPDSFDNVIAQESIKPDPGSYTIPANYPTHHPKAGTAHPQRGQADLYALVTALEPEWTRRCKRGYIKPVPRGMVNEVYDNTFSHAACCFARRQSASELFVVARNRAS